METKVPTNDRRIIMSIKVVTIDFWNTLFNSDNGVERNQYRNMLLKENFEEMGYHFTDEQYKKAMLDSWEYFNNIWLNEQRTPLTGELVEFYWDRIGVERDEKRIDDIVYLFEESLLKFRPSLMNGVREALPKLSKKYQLALVSDTGFSPGSILKVLLHKEGIYNYFSAFSFSDETGVSKPNKKAFRHILNELKCKPEEAIHIGDIENTDIVGAKTIGMQAIRFSGDETALFDKHNPDETIADTEASHWSEIPDLIEGIGNE